MNLRRLFLHDIGRKLLALLLALLVWWKLNSEVSTEISVDFTIETASFAKHPEKGKLLFHLPAGWMLAKPRPGTTVSINFRGPKATLNAFVDSERCAASFQPSELVSVNASENRYTLDLTPEELKWLRDDDAQPLLRNAKAAPGLTSLVFMRKTSQQVTLDASHFRVEGELPEGFKVITDKVVMEPNMVTLSGPVGQIQDLGNERNGYIPFLQALRLPEQHQAELQIDLSLGSGISELITMQPASVRVKVPIQRVQRVEFIPKSEPVLVPPRDDWETPLWTGKKWVAELVFPPALDGFSLGQPWLEDNVQLILPSNQIPDDPDLQNYRLPILWALTGTNDDVIPILRKAIDIRPVQEEDGKVSVSRVAGGEQG